MNLFASHDRNVGKVQRTEIFVANDKCQRIRGAEHGNIRIQNIKMKGYYIYFAYHTNNITVSSRMTRPFFEPYIPNSKRVGGGLHRRPPTPPGIR